MRPEPASSSPGPAPGRGRIGWAWCDACGNDLLTRTGAVADGVVQHSIRPQDAPDDTLAILAKEARRWPRPWRDGILASIRNRDVLGPPIAERAPVRLGPGRLAIVGNAAHVPTPMIGQGFDASVQDAETLARLLNGAEPGDISSRLAQYERDRLTDVQQLVRRGQSFSRSFGG